MPHQTWFWFFNAVSPFSFMLIFHIPWWKHRCSYASIAKKNFFFFTEQCYEARHGFCRSGGSSVSCQHFPTFGYWKMDLFHRWILKNEPNNCQSQFVSLFPEHFLCAAFGTHICTQRSVRMQLCDRWDILVGTGFSVRPKLCCCCCCCWTSYLS